MEREQLLTMEPYILLSWANMKLRDQFDSLASLCDDYDIAEEELGEILGSIGYFYNNDRNQFMGV